MTEENRNPFKEMDQYEKPVPPELRKKVMRNIALAKFIMEVASLFSTNYSSALENLFKTKGRY